MSLIACVQIPNLPLALARRERQAPVDRPLVLYAVERGRAAVYAASEEAGIATGMPLRQARVRCPQATYLLAESERDHEVVAALLALLVTFSPRVAQSQPLPDVAFALDLGKLSNPQIITLVGRLAQRMRAELELPAAFGVASNRLVAHHAAMRAGAGVALIVPPGDEAAFLAPQRVSSLVLDTTILDRLDRLGLRTIGDVARLPLDALQAQLGGASQHLYQLARGLDAAPIPTTSDAPTLSRSRRFAGPLLARDVLEQAIAELAARLAAQLLANGWAAGTLTLTLIVDDGAPLVLERRLAEPTSDGRLLLQILLALSRSAVLQSGVTAISVTASDLVPVVVEQLDLFAPTGGQARRLRDLLDRLAGRFAESLLRAQLADPNAPLPEQRVRLESR